MNTDTAERDPRELRPAFRCDYSGRPSEPCEGVCIPLSSGYHAIIDSEDYDKISHLRWAISASANGYQVPYIKARANIKRNGRGGSLSMHRAVTEEKYKMVDHINRNTLDNRKSNLREATVKQNSYNKASILGSTSKYKGVRLYKGGKYCAQIKTDGKVTLLGFFDDEVLAAKAYDRAAYKRSPEFVWLNFPELKETYAKDK